MCYDGMCSVLGFDKSILAVNVVLMIHYVYVMVIYDGMCIRNMENILCEVVFLTFMKIMSTGGKGAWRWIKV